MKYLAFILLLFPASALAQEETWAEIHEKFALDRASHKKKMPHIFTEFSTTRKNEMEGKWYWMDYSIPKPDPVPPPRSRQSLLDEAYSNQMLKANQLREGRIVFGNSFDRHVYDNHFANSALANEMYTPLNAVNGGGSRGSLWAQQYAHTQVEQMKQRMPALDPWKPSKVKAKSKTEKKSR